MAKVIIAAILGNESNETNFVIDDTGVVESIDELTTYIRDNQDESMGIIFEFFFTVDPSINYESGISSQMDGIAKGVQISYQTALMVLCNKGL